MDTPKQIYALIPKIMGEIGHVAKARQAKMGAGDNAAKYAFRGIDDAYAALQPLLAANGVFIVPRLIDCKRESVTTDRGGVRTTTVVTVEFDVTAPDGSVVTSRMVGEAMDAGDKSASKAQSVAMREMVWKLFCVPTASTDNDPEHDGHDNGNGHATPPAPPAPPKAPDLSDFAAFRVELGRAFAARAFSADDMIRGVKGLTDHFKVAKIDDIPADKRAACIANVAKGNLDRFKAPAKATPTQVTRFHELLVIAAPPDGEVEKRMGAAGVSMPEEMTAPQLASLIAYLESLTPAQAEA